MLGKIVHRFVLAILLGCTIDSHAHAEAETFKGEYIVSYLGITIARSTFDSQVGEGTFSVNGTVASAGLAKLFDSTKGTASSTGDFAGDRTLPSRFRMNYTEGRRKQMTAMAFKGGDVVSTENVPPLKKRNKKRWIPLAQGDLKNAIDPLSAGLIRASAPDKVCGRTLRLFDGEFRMDAVLRRSENSPAASQYGDQVVSCSVKVKPVSGYRKGRESLEFLEKKSRIVVAFAPLGSTGIYAPVHATIGTEIGTVTVSARKLDAQ